MGVIILGLSIGVVIFIIKVATLFPLTRKITSISLLLVMDICGGYACYRIMLAIGEPILLPFAMVSYFISCISWLTFEKLYSLARRYCTNVR